MSQSMTLARPYARAAYTVASDAGQATQWSQALAFRALGRRSAGGHRARRSAPVARGCVRLVAPDNAPEAVRGFLGLLATNGRLAVLPEISGLFEQARAEPSTSCAPRSPRLPEMSAGELDTIKAALDVASVARSKCRRRSIRR